MGHAFSDGRPYRESISIAELACVDGRYVDSWREIECVDSQFCRMRMHCRWYISSGRFVRRRRGCIGPLDGPLMPCSRARLTRLLSLLSTTLDARTSG